MRKQLISFAQVIKFLQHIKLKGEGWTRVAESEVFGWSRITNNTGRRSRIFCPTPYVHLDHFYITLLNLEFLLKWYNFFWNRDFLLCRLPRFPLILTAKFNSLYVKESESEILETRSRESEILGSRSRIFYLRLRNLGFNPNSPCVRPWCTRHIALVAINGSPDTIFAYCNMMNLMQFFPQICLFLW